MFFIILLFLCVVGLCLGSFTNALTWRLYERKQLLGKETSLSKINKQYYAKLSILKGRSMCPKCKHTLMPIDLVPILSWLALKGRCRYCHEHISWQYPVVEISTALIFIASYIWWPVTISGIQIVEFILWLLLVVGLVALAIYDIKWSTLPNRIIYPLSCIAFVLAIIVATSSHQHLKAILDIIFAVIIGGGIFYALFQISKGKWIGGGDVRLGFLLGLIMATPAKSVLLIFLASLIGSLISLPLLATHKLKRNSTIPFGPFLILAAIITELVGHFILSWYQNTFFPYGV